MARFISAWISAILVLTVAGLPCARAEEATKSAVTIHDEFHLPASKTVWCLGNEAEFLSAAQALGLDISAELVGSENKIKRPGGEGDFYELAASADAADVSAFDSACRLAYEAFSRSEARPDESESFLESQSGIVNVFIGAILAVVFGTLGAIPEARKSQARELTLLSGQLEEGIRRFVRLNYDQGLAEEAEVKARSLRDRLEEWKAMDDRGHSEVSTSIDRLRAILGEAATEPKPAISSVYENRADRSTIGKSLTETAEELDSLVAKVGRRIESPFRLHRRKPG